MPQRFIIISAINDYYFPLLTDLLRSLRACKTSFAFDIGILDVGLNKDNIQQLASFDVFIKQPGIDIDYPGRVAWELKSPYFRAMTSRPSLPSYFPGYDAYMWIDADAWVQTPEALETMLLNAANDTDLYIASEYDLAYPIALRNSGLWQEWATSFQNCFPPNIAAAMFLRPLLNVGVFAMSPHAPHWTIWHTTLAQALNVFPEIEQKHFAMEQLCLNLIIHRGALGVQVMPAEYNWMTVYGLPILDENSGLYMRPTPPHRVISIVHLAAQIKNSLQTITTTKGTTIQKPLTYSAAYRKKSED